MQGIYVRVETAGTLATRRPKSKKEVREIVALDPSRVSVESTSVFGDEWHGPLSAMPEGFRTVHFVGPDPYTSRKFYGSITRSGEGFKVK